MDCKKHCQVLSKQNEEAMEILADLAFVERRYEEAAQHYENLLKKKSNNYRALHKYITIKWRAGDLESAKRVLKNAEKG